MFNGMPVGITDISPPPATCPMCSRRPIARRCWAKLKQVDTESLIPIRLGGPSCLAGDVIGDYRLPVPAEPGARFAFLDQAHYSMVKTNTFNGVAAAFDLDVGQRDRRARLHQALRLRGFPRPVNFTDAVLVLHRGVIVYERYLGVTRQDTPHIAFSVTKSFVGTLAEMLIEEGRLDPAAPMGDLIPELKRSGFADATLRQVMDMTTAIDFSEEYTDPNSGIGAMSNALGLTPRAPGYAGPTDVYAFLPMIGKAGEHGQRFTYRTANTEVLGWLVARTEGKRLDRVLSERIWQPLGMEQDADFLIDSTGMPFAGGGLNPVLRDMARFGEAMRLDGAGNGGQAIAREVVARSRPGAAGRSFSRPDTSGCRTVPTRASGGQPAGITVLFLLAGFMARRSGWTRWPKW
jgi:CubicO group peptidase (beta-lactamase class C family)